MSKPSKARQHIVRIVRNGRGQAVRLPKECEFSTAEVCVRKQGDDVILSAWPANWSTYLSSDRVASDEFMQGIEDLPVQNR